MPWELALSDLIDSMKAITITIDLAYSEKCPIRIRAAIPRRRHHLGGHILVHPAPTNPPAGKPVSAER